MTIQTKSSFYYIEAINQENVYLNFIEPNKDNTELAAIMVPSSYSQTELVQAVETALNDAGENEYTVVFDRSTRKYTISADDDFDLLVTTGSNSGLSAYAVLGYTSDKTGGDSYEGDDATGSVYRPQVLLQDYVDKDNNIDGIEPSVNESASGVIEVVTFGNRKFYEFNIKWITDNEKAKGSAWDNNQVALQDARDFMTFCITKGRLEFMPDRDMVSEFTTVLLESTRESRIGTGFTLKEMNGLIGYFETGVLKFRVV